MKRFLSLIGILSALTSVQAQGPWDNDIRIAFSNDGTNFSPSTFLLDSADVPSIALRDDGSLIAAFQWFQGNPDGKVALMTSTDNGATWTSPVLANFINQPAGLFKPVDPTLVNIGGGQLRMYFSIGEGMITDSTLDVFSATSSDGLNFTFDSGVAAYSDSIEIIEPAVGFVNGTWHLVYSIGAPWLGASHTGSANGLNFTPAAHIPSDTAHSWIGNFMNEGGATRFYGSTPNFIWWASTTDGLNYGTYVQTNVAKGFNPAVTKMADSSYVMIFIDKNAPPLGVEDPAPEFSLYPNPANDRLIFRSTRSIEKIEIIDLSGAILKSVNANSIPLEDVSSGMYFARIFTRSGEVSTLKFIKK